MRRWYFILAVMGLFLTLPFSFALLLAPANAAQSSKCHCLKAPDLTGKEREIAYQRLGLLAAGLLKPNEYCPRQLLNLFDDQGVQVIKNRGRDPARLRSQLHQSSKRIEEKCQPKLNWSHLVKKPKCQCLNAINLSGDKRNSAYVNLRKFVSGNGVFVRYCPGQLLNLLDKQGQLIVKKAGRDPSRVSNRFRQSIELLKRRCPSDLDWAILIKKPICKCLNVKNLSDNRREIAYKNLRAFVSGRSSTVRYCPQQLLGLLDGRGITIIKKAYHNPDRAGMWFNRAVESIKRECPSDPSELDWGDLIKKPICKCLNARNLSRKKRKIAYVDFRNFVSGRRSTVLYCPQQLLNLLDGFGVAIIKQARRKPNRARTQFYQSIAAIEQECTNDNPGDGTVLTGPPEPTEPIKPAPPKPQEPHLPDWQKIPKLKPGFLQYSLSYENPQEALIPNRYFVLFDEPALRAAGIDIKVISKKALIERLSLKPGMIETVFRNSFKGMILLGGTEQAAILSRHRLVRAVQQDTTMTMMARANHSHALDRIDQIHAKLNKRFVPRKEKMKVRAYVVDSGIRHEHDQVAGKVKLWRALTSPLGGTTKYLCEVHGTAMASLIAGKNTGVAKNVELIDVVLVPCASDDPKLARGNFKTTDLLRVFNWIAGREHKISGSAEAMPFVVNMSLASSAHWFTEEDPKQFGQGAMELALTKFVSDTGATIMAAAGNGSNLKSAQDACKLFPALMKEVITVGATGLDDRIAEFSYFGNCVDVFAPGEDVTAANAVNLGELTTIKGTSAATALVSGIVAHRLAAGDNLADIRKNLSRNVPRPDRKYLQRILDNPGQRGFSAESGNLQSILKSVASIQNQKHSGAVCVVKTPDGFLVLRGGPSHRSQRIFSMENKTKVHVLKRKGRWFYVKTNRGRKGWAAVRSRLGTLLYKLNSRSQC